MTIDPFSTLGELSSALARKRVSAVELAELYLARIAQANPKLNAFVAVDAELALAYARASDARRASGLTLGPLDGLPIALKDLLEIEGRITGVGSAAWKQRRSTKT
ncbi:MAG: amidase family protein, partial [Pseudomonadota bacterium]